MVLSLPLQKIFARYAEGIVFTWIFCEWAVCAC